MKPTTALFFAMAILATCFRVDEIAAQEYKLKQSIGMSGMLMETTIYVKGKRKRTESDGMMGMGQNEVTIEQCDLKRTIRLNTKKKLYYIEPFSQSQPEVIDDNVQTAANKQPAKTNTTKKGGTITMYYAVLDSGKRQDMHGFKARHLWTHQRIKPSDDACMMKDSLIMRVEGWYIDLPEWTCPVSYAYNGSAPNTPDKPDCQDKFVARTSGNGKLGFPLWERRIMYFNDGSGKISEMATETNTIELITTKLDSLLFTIPTGYTETKNVNDLEDAFDVNAYINQVKDYNPDHHNNNPGNANSGDKPAGMIRVGILAPMGGESVDASVLQQYLVQVMRGDNVQAVAVSGEDDAKSKQCDYLLHSNLPRMKQASKIGGIVKAIKNSDPGAANSWNIDAELKLTALGDGSVKSQEKVSGKYSGQPDNAAQQALGEGAGKVLRAIQ